MLNIVAVFLAISIIFLIVPQTPTENVVLRRLVETGFFTDYSKAREFLNWTSWSLIFGFLIVLIFLNF